MHQQTGNVKHRTIKLREDNFGEENIGENIDDLGYDAFIDKTKQNLSKKVTGKIVELDTLRTKHTYTLYFIKVNNSNNNPLNCEI